MPSPPKDTPDKEMLKAFEAAGLVDYLEYLQSGKRIMLTNFKAGVAKGLGLTLGMSVVLGAAAWVLTMLVDLPVIGEYAAEAEAFVNEYTENSNYTDEFAEMNGLLREIKENTADADRTVSAADVTAAVESAAAEVAGTDVAGTDVAGTGSDVASAGTVTDSP